jgi:hypothetical protein
VAAQPTQEYVKKLVSDVLFIPRFVSAALPFSIFEVRNGATQTAPDGVARVGIVASVKHEDRARNHFERSRVLPALLEPRHVRPGFIVCAEIEWFRDPVALVHTDIGVDVGRPHQAVSRHELLLGAESLPTQTFELRSETVVHPIRYSHFHSGAGFLIEGAAPNDRNSADARRVPGGVRECEHRSPRMSDEGGAVPFASRDDQGI